MFGLLDLSFWGYILTFIGLSQITIAVVTIYLHRCQTHRALTLHPIVSHFFRFWLWMTTGMVTKEWVAIHRKHHAHSDVEGDPHSPKVFGIKKVFWEGAELYQEAAKDKAMLAKYGKGTPNDWLEKNLYSKHSAKGIALLFIIYACLFGLPGITMWALQMIWIPLWAAGVVNGLGHYVGYRNFECLDAATNLFPLGFWIGGEELHNNHHTFASSAKFSVKKWEFDMGWFYIRVLSALKLAKVKKLPPQLVRQEGKRNVDLETVKAVINNRFQVMANYYHTVVRPILRLERATAHDKKVLQRAGKLLKSETTLLTPRASMRLHTVLQQYEKLRLVYNFRQNLQEVWQKTATSQKELIDALHNWCIAAEASGVDVLKQFSLHLKGYVPRIV